MTTFRSRLLAFALTLMMVTALIPLTLQRPAAAENDLGMTTADKVNLRYSASPKSEYIVRLPNQYVCTVLNEVDQEGYHWFQVEAIDPENGRKQIGYIRGDCFRQLTDEEANTYQTSGTTASSSRKPASRLSKLFHMICSTSHMTSENLVAMTSLVKLASGADSSMSCL